MHSRQLFTHKIFHWTCGESPFRSARKAAGSCRACAFRTEVRRHAVPEDVAHVRHMVELLEQGVCGHAVVGCRLLEQLERCGRIATLRDVVRHIADALGHQPPIHDLALPRVRVQLGHYGHALRVALRQYPTAERGAHPLPNEELRVKGVVGESPRPHAHRHRRLGVGDLHHVLRLVGGVVRMLWVPPPPVVVPVPRVARISQLLPPQDALGARSHGLVE
mmetsp:Transcript_20992/g.48107  ORF Transcript_20992/g.48107 Transcript_20992/m.48107 type:complete len:220 (+) Transcript_20992:269-928(+)